MIHRLHNILILATIAIVAMAQVACVENDRSGLFDQKMAVEFSAVVGPTSQTRDVITGLTYPNDLPFAAFAVELPDGKNWINHKADAVEFIDGDEVAYDTYLSGKWTTQTPYYWPYFGTVSFFAYSPWADALGNKITNINFTPTTGELAVSGWDVNDTKYQGVDLMIADPQYDLVSALAPSGVPVAFRHKLSLLSFRAGLTSEYIEGGNTYQIKLLRVELRNVYTEGDYSTTTESGRWVNLSESETIVIYDKTASGGESLSHESPTILGQNIVAMPQGHVDNSSTGAQIVVTYLDTHPDKGYTETAKIVLKRAYPSSIWSMNNHYTYVIMFDRGDPSYIEFEQPTISADWQNGGTFELIID